MFYCTVLSFEYSLGCDTREAAVVPKILCDALIGHCGTLLT